MARLVYCLAALSLASIPMTVEAALFYVSPQGSDNVLCGVTQIIACRTIQYAYDNRASAGDEIRALPGEYDECVRAWGFPEAQDKPVRLVANAWVSDQDRTMTIIDGDGICSQGTRRAPAVLIGGNGATLEGFTIRGGGRSGVVARGSVTITNNLITGNTSRLGGGVYFYSAGCVYGNVDATIAGNRITGNSAPVLPYVGPCTSEGVCTGDGAAICSGDEDCAISGDGGGVYVLASGVRTSSSAGCQDADTSLAIEDNEIESNTSANGFGGGIYAFTNTAPSSAVDVAITRNVITGNRVQDSGAWAYGGGVWASTFGFGSETIEIRDNSIEGNTSDGDGGGVSAAIDLEERGSHSINVRGNRVRDNHAEGRGGGIDVLMLASDMQAGESASVAVNDNVVEGNSSFDYGGGIVGDIIASRSGTTGPAASTRTFDVSGNRVTSNRADTAGGGVALLATATSDPGLDGSDRQADAVVEFTNNLVAGNNGLCVLGGQPCAIDFDCAFDDLCANLAPGAGLFVFLEPLGGYQGMPATATANIRHSTIAANTSNRNSAGIEIEARTRFDGDTPPNEGRAVVLLQDSIVSGNIGDPGYGIGGPPAGFGGIFVAGDSTHNLIVTVTNSDVFGNPRNYERVEFQNIVCADVPRTRCPGTAADLRVPDPQVCVDAGGSPTCVASGGNIGEDPADDPLLDSITFTPDVCESPVYGLDIGHLMSPDINADRVVDGIDVLRLAPGFGARTGEGRYLSNVDLNRNGEIDGLDLSIVSGDFGRICP